MGTQCLIPVRGEVARITRVNACGAPVFGAKSQLVTDGFVSVEGEVQLEDGQEYKLKGANDLFIVNRRGQPQIKWIDLTLNFGKVDPDAYNMVTGSPLVMNDAATPEAVGYRVREGSTAYFALELWTDLDGAVCIGGAVAYGYLLLPFVKDAVVGKWTWQNDVITFPVQSARTERASQWGVGPHNVVNKIAAPSGPSPLLTPIDPKDHMHMQLTTLAPPSPTCGATLL